MILELVIVEYKRKKLVSIIFERLWLFSIEGCTIWICTVLKPLKRAWNQTAIFIADI